MSPRFRRLVRASQGAAADLGEAAPKRGAAAGEERGVSEHRGGGPIPGGASEGATTGAWALARSPSIALSPLFGGGLPY